MQLWHGDMTSVGTEKSQICQGVVLFSGLAQKWKHPRYQIFLSVYKNGIINIKG